MSDLDIRDMRPDERPEDFAGIRRSTYLAWVRRHAPKRRRFDGPTRRDTLLKIGAIVLARHWPDALDGLTDMESQRERIRTAKCFVGMEYGLHTHATLRECLYDEWGYKGTGG